MIELYLFQSNHRLFYNQTKTGLKFLEPEFFFIYVAESFNKI